MKRIVFGAAAALAMRVAGVVCTSATFIIVARTLELHDVGAYALISSLALLGRYLGPLGFDQLAIKSIPELIARDDPNAVQCFQQVSIYRVAAISIITAIVMMILYVAIPTFRSAINPVSLACGAMIYALSAVSGLASALIRARGLVIQSILPDSLLNPLVATCATAVIAGMRLSTLSNFVFALLASSLIAVIAQAISLKTLSTREKPWNRANPGRPAWRAAFGLWLVVCANYLQSRSAIYFAAMTGGAAASAIMDSANKFALVPTLGTWAIGSIFAPKLVQIHSKKDLEDLQLHVSYASWLAFIPAFVFLLVLTLFAVPVIHALYGDKFSGAVVPAILVVLASTINAGGSISSTLLMYTSHNRLVLAFTLVAFVISAALSIVLGARFGVTGIALAILFSTIFRDVGLSVRLKSLASVSPGVYSLRGGRTFYHSLISSISPRLRRRF